MVEGGMKCIKLLLFFFNLLFVLVGIGLIGCGSYVQIKLTEYNDILGSQYTGPGIVLIIVGVIVFAIAFFGCCGAYKENYCMVMTFAVLLSFIFIILIAGGIAAFVLKDQIESEITSVMLEKVKEYDSDKGVKEAFDKLQEGFKCCGVTGPGDWNNTIPQSCCESGTAPNCTTYPDGCEKKFVEFLKDNIGIIAGAGVGLAFIHVVGIIFACCLARAIRKEYEVV